MDSWIDPFDMNPGYPPVVDDFKKTDATTLQLVSNRRQDFTCAKEDLFAASFYKRVIGMILNTLSPDTDTSYQGYVSFQLPIEDYQRLSDFAKSENLDKKTFHEVDFILQKMHSKMSEGEISRNMVNWLEFMQMFLTSRSMTIMLCVILLVMFCIHLYKTKITIWTTMRYFLFGAFIIDFAFTWIDLYQKAEVNKMADMSKLRKIPDACDPAKASLWANVWEFLRGSDDCREYHQIMFKDIYYSVSPIAVLSEQFKTPASNIGSSIGNLVHGIIGRLPWGVNIVLLPLILLCMAVIICIVTAFLTKTGFKVNILHLVKFEFSNRNIQTVENVITWNRLLRINDEISHRPTIQEVPHLLQESKHEITKTLSVENKQHLESIEAKKDSSFEENCPELKSTEEKLVAEKLKFKNTDNVPANESLNYKNRLDEESTSSNNSKKSKDLLNKENIKILNCDMRGTDDGLAHLPDDSNQFLSKILSVVNDDALKRSEEDKQISLEEFLASEREPNEEIRSKGFVKKIVQELFEGKSVIKEQFSKSDKRSNSKNSLNLENKENIDSKNSSANPSQDQCTQTSFQFGEN